MSEDYISPQELEQRVISELKNIYDPEIPVNIYDLGLIYDVAITAENEVVVLMTLTTPNCPEAAGLPAEVQECLRNLEGVKDAKVLLTFDPPWDRSMMSEIARFELGFM